MGRLCYKIKKEMSEVQFKEGDIVRFINDKKTICKVENVIDPGKEIRNGQINTTGEVLYRLVGANVFVWGIHFLVHENEIEINQ